MAGLALVGLAAVLYWSTSTSRRVETVEVTNRDIREIYVATGRLEAPRTSDLAVDVAGVIEHIAVDAGVEVERGEALIELRPRDAELAVKQAKARVKMRRNELEKLRRGATDAELNAAKSRVDQFASKLAQAQRELTRTQDLNERQLATDQELEQARTAVEQARAQVDNAQANFEQLRETPLRQDLQAARARLEEAKVDLERAQDDIAETTIRAPFDGLVLEIDADAGERVTPNQSVIRIADMSSAEIYAEVDEDYFGRLEDGQPVTLIFPSMPKKTFSATLHRVGPEMATDRGVVGVHITPQRLPDNVFPGLTVDANIEVARLKNTPAAPADAVIRDPAGTYVLTIEGGTATRRPVDIRARGDRWMALSGIEPGTRIIDDAARTEVGDSVTPTPTDGR